MKAKRQIESGSNSVTMLDGSGGHVTRLEVRAEGFNVTNSFRPGNPGVTVGSGSSFGLIQADATPPAGVTGGSSTNAPARVLQFALKYVF